VAAAPRLDPPFGTFAPTPAQERVVRLARGTFLRRGDFRKVMVDWLLGLRDGPIDYRFRELNYRLNIRDNTGEQAILLNAAYNAGELAFLADGLKPGGVFVDVGANVGLFSLPLAVVVGPKGVVLAVEPDPVIRARLEINVAANDTPAVRILPYALGDREGEAAFIQDDRNLGHNRVGESGGITVPMKPMLIMLTEAGVTRVDAFKIDVEGFEDKVLNPFFETAPRGLWPRRVVIEKLHAGGGGDTPIRRMMALGYRKHGGNRANLFLVLPEEPA
jgi:FkbM family methyltransferase